MVAVDPRRLGAVFLWSLAVWALDVLTAVLVLAALVGGLGGLVPAPTLLAVGALAVSVGNLAKVLPLSQGGIGLYEAAFTGLVASATGLPVETALAAAILDHALKNAVTLAGGGTAALAFGLSPTAGSRSGGEPTPSATVDPARDGESTRAPKADGGSVAGGTSPGATGESEASNSGPPNF